MRTEARGEGGGIAAEQVSGFDIDEMELGEWAWGAQAPFALRFQNGSAVPLVVSGIRRSCDCTILDTPIESGTVIETGGSLELRGVIEVGDKVGRLSRTIVLKTADGTEYSAKLRLSVIPTFRVSPDHLTFDVLESEEVSRQSLFFQSDSIALAGSPESDVPWLAATTDGEQINVTFLPNKMHGTRGLGMITLKTTDPQMPTYAIAIEGTIRREVNFYPPRAYVSPGHSATVQVVGSAGEALRVHEIRLSPDESDDVMVSVVADGVIEVRAVAAAAVPGTVRVNIVVESGAVGPLEIVVYSSEGSE